MLGVLDALFLFLLHLLEAWTDQCLLMCGHTDTDSKIKVMIKIIDEDADSFARRAEMYYKRRPELMSLLEELYRAYRALAERYDHAAGELRHAHKKMAEAFPDEFQLDFDDDLPTETASAESETDNRDMTPFFLSFVKAGDSKKRAKGIPYTVKFPQQAQYPNT